MNILVLSLLQAELLTAPTEAPWPSHWIFSAVFFKETFYLTSKEKLTPTSLKYLRMRSEHVSPIYLTLINITLSPNRICIKKNIHTKLICKCCVDSEYNLPAHLKELYQDQVQLTSELR